MWWQYVAISSLASTCQYATDNLCFLYRFGIARCFHFYRSMVKLLNPCLMTRWTNNPSRYDNSTCVAGTSFFCLFTLRPRELIFLHILAGSDNYNAEYNVCSCDGADYYSFGPNIDCTICPATTTQTAINVGSCQCPGLQTFDTYSGTCSCNAPDECQCLPGTFYLCPSSETSA